MIIKISSFTIEALSETFSLGHADAWLVISKDSQMLVIVIINALFYCRCMVR